MSLRVFAPGQGILVSCSRYCILRVGGQQFRTRTATGKPACRHRTSYTLTPCLLAHNDMGMHVIGLQSCIAVCNIAMHGCNLALNCLLLTLLENLCTLLVMADGGKNPVWNETFTFNVSPSSRKALVHANLHKCVAVHVTYLWCFCRHVHNCLISSAHVPALGKIKLSTGIPCCA